MVNLEAEAKQPEFKRQAQEWASIVQNLDLNLFVFVGRWSKQKGVNLRMVLMMRPKGVDGIPQKVKPHIMLRMYVREQA